MIRAGDMGASTFPVNTAAAFLGVLIFGLIVIFSIFDAILRRQYAIDRHDWEAQGKARGYFSDPAQRSNPMAGSMARELLLHRVAIIATSVA